MGFQLFCGSTPELHDDSASILLLFFGRPGTHQVRPPSECGPSREFAICLAEQLPLHRAGTAGNYCRYSQRGPALLRSLKTRHEVPLDAHLSADSGRMTFQEIIDLHPHRSDLDRDLLLRCIEECLDCAASCTDCADACLGESDLPELRRCVGSTSTAPTHARRLAGSSRGKPRPISASSGRSSKPARWPALPAPRSAIATPRTTNTVASAPPSVVSASRRATTSSQRSANPPALMAAPVPAAASAAARVVASSRGAMAPESGRLRTTSRSRDRRAHPCNRLPRFAGLFYGRYWARTSDPQLVELVLSQLS
jgi:hypothetical protein